MVFYMLVLPRILNRQLSRGSTPEGFPLILKNTRAVFGPIAAALATPFLVIPITRDLALFLFFLLLFVYPPSLSYGIEFLVSLQTKLTNVRKGGIVESEEKLL